MSIRNINRLTPLFDVAVVLTLAHLPSAAAADSTEFLKAASQGGKMEVSLGGMATRSMKPFRR